MACLFESANMFVLCGHLNALTLFMNVLARMENQHYNNDQWAYDLVANIDHQLPNCQESPHVCCQVFFCLYFLLYDQLIFIYVGNLSQLGGHNGVGNEGGTDTSNAPVVDLEEQTPRQSRRKPPTVLKNVSRRGGGFTKEEDAIICSAFLNVSKDAIVGVNQSSGGYYKRMHEFFEAHKPLGSNRSQLAIKGRWGVIQNALNRFSGFKSIIDRRNESGKNEVSPCSFNINLFFHCLPSK